MPEIVLHLLALVFRCSHRRTTWPLSRVRGKRVPTYVVCLECGREFRYAVPNADVPATVPTKEASETA